MTKTILKLAFFQRWNWGTCFAGSYLVVSVPCAAAYLMHPHEYSIPGMIVYYASLPTDFFLFEVLHPLMRNLGRLPHGVALVLLVQMAVSTLLYFAVGYGLGLLVRRMARRTVHHKPGVNS